MKVVCSGVLIRYPLGGLSWHHVQYVVGLRRMGHEVVYLEDHGWERSCYDVARNCMTSDPSYGISCLLDLLRGCAEELPWCYLAEDGKAHGLTREQLAEHCRECDLYLNLSNVNWIPELELCRRRVLVDTDPVFTQMHVLGQSPPLSHHVHLTFGENVHRPGCSMPTGDQRWLPTRQPVVLDLWRPTEGVASAKLTTVMSWDPIGDQHYQGRVFGGKAREFETFCNLPNDCREPMEVALILERKYCDPPAVRKRLSDGGWSVVDPLRVTRTPWDYQHYLRTSRAEFAVAKHAYVTTQCGWFSERSTSYLASGRPVIVQDTGFSRFLPCGSGLLCFRNRAEAIQAIHQLRKDYSSHCQAARSVIAEYFDARKVLTRLLELSL
jgi:hypothetical protein